MPNIIFKGVKKDDIKKISRELVDNLKIIIDCPRDYFVLQVADITFISDGEEVEKYPMIEVGWFNRTQDIQDKTASKITRALNSVGYSHVEIIFAAYKENCYYENGEHY